MSEKILVFLLLLNPVLAAGELTLDNTRFDPLPEAVSLAVREGAPPPSEFSRAALLFSGVDREEIGVYIGKIQAMTREISNAFAGRTRDRTLAENLLQFLHKKYLSRYDAFETRIHTLLDTGVFNCVSSSILYLIAAEQLGIAAGGVRTKDHAFVTVMIAGIPYDVETTSRFGFDPGKKKEFLDEFGRTTGFVYTPPGHYSDRRDIDLKESLSLILNNRIAELGKKGAFDKATGPGADIFELLKNEESLTMLIGIYTGLARRALDGRHYAVGYTILDRAVAAYREFDQFQELRRMFILEWSRLLIEQEAFADVQSLLDDARHKGKIPESDYREMLLLRYHRAAEAVVRTGGFLEALSVLEEGRRVLGDNDSIIKAEKTFAYNHVLAMTEKGRFEEVPVLLERFQKAGLLGQPEFDRLYVFYAQKKAEAAARGQDHETALKVIEDGMIHVAKDRALLKSAEVYAYNYAIKLISSSQFSAAGEFLSSDRAIAYLERGTREELAQYLVQARAESQRQTGDYERALATLEEGLASLGRRTALLKSYETMIHNFMITFYERKDYARAEEVLLKGLRIHPASPLLKKDLSQVRKEMNR